MLSLRRVMAAQTMYEVFDEIETFPRRCIDDFRSGLAGPMSWPAPSRGGCLGGRARRRASLSRDQRIRPSITNLTELATDGLARRGSRSAHE
jgi:hypothetical protein